jgi:flagellar protein FlaF
VHAQNTAERGYLQNVSSTRSERRTEYEVIARITHRLRDAAQRAKRDYPGYVAALHDNRKLWQAFAIDVSHKDNQLPDELRARIFYLSEFTEKHTQDILRNKASVVPLLEINLALLRGLKNERQIS